MLYSTFFVWDVAGSMLLRLLQCMSMINGMDRVDKQTWGIVATVLELSRFTIIGNWKMRIGFPSSAAVT